MTPSLTVSADWLKQQAQRESRVEYHGPAVRWPIKKILNASPLWNRAQREKEQRSA